MWLSSSQCLSQALHCDMQWGMLARGSGRSNEHRVLTSGRYVSGAVWHICVLFTRPIVFQHDLQTVEEDSLSKGDVIADRLRPGHQELSRRDSDGPRMSQRNSLRWLHDNTHSCCGSVVESTMDHRAPTEHLYSRRRRDAVAAGAMVLLGACSGHACATAPRGGQCSAARALDCKFVYDCFQAGCS